MDARNDTARYRDQTRTTARFLLWTIAWLATLAAARFGPQFLWDAELQPGASWAAVGLNVLVGIVWIVAFAHVLRALDDLWRKIMLDALAVTLGVGWVVGFGYFVADAAGLIAYDLNVALFPVLLGVVYMITVGVGRLRFR